ncbi:hypothetical protein QYF36_026624 [Acer negundo]|nr:hypothetical protein QYF36_026624 [Acer negundo]
MRVLSPWYPSDDLLRKSLKGGLVTVARLKEKTHLIGWVARERKRRFKDLLRIENETIKRNRLYKGCILMSFPLSNIIPNKINLMIKWEAFDVMLEEDKQLIISSWFDELLGLRSKPWNSNLNSPSKSKQARSQADGVCINVCKGVVQKRGFPTAAKQIWVQSHTFCQPALQPVQSFPEVIGNRSAEKGKGIWIKKAKKGESSRGRLYVGPQSPSLDLIIKAHPRPSPEGFVANGGKSPSSQSYVEESEEEWDGGKWMLQEEECGSDFDGSELGKIRSEDFRHVLKLGNGLNGGLISNLGDNESAEFGEISLSVVLPTPHLKRNCKLKGVLARSHRMKMKGDKRSEPEATYGIKSELGTNVEIPVQQNSMAEIKKYVKQSLELGIDLSKNSSSYRQ